MKRLKMSFLLPLQISMAIAVLSGCFNPLDYDGPKGGNGLISINLPGASSARAALPNKDALDYELTFFGPGGQTLTKTARGGGTVSVQVNPGKWSVTVKAFDPAAPGTPKAIGESAAIDVRAGASNSVPVKMAVYTEVSTWGDLKNAVEQGNYDDFIVIKNDLTASNPPINNIISKTVTIVTENNVTISGNGTTLLTVGAAGHLVLGSPAYSGELTLDGTGSSLGAIIHVISSSGTLTMNSGTLSGNTYNLGTGGVLNVGTFTMNGGTISGNTGSNGGGVNNSKTFIMNNGTISGNTASNGGGVYTTGTFTMTGGEISGNTAASGASLYVASGGTARFGNGLDIPLDGAIPSGTNADLYGATGTVVAVYSIGDFGPAGGKIFYVDSVDAPAGNIWKPPRRMFPGG